MKQLKRNFYCVLILAALFACHPAQAELLVYEGFGYNESPLGLQNGGYGWLDGWCQVYNEFMRTGDSPIAIEPDKTLPMANYTFSGVRGRANIKYIDSPNMAERSLGTPLLIHSPGTYYISYLMQNNSENAFYLQFCRMAKKVYGSYLAFTIGWDNERIGLRVAQESYAFSPEGSSPIGETQLVVVKLVNDPNSGFQAYGKIYGSDDEFDISDENLTWDVSTTGTIPTDSIYGIDGMKIVCGTNADALIDEFRIGTEWNDVVPGAQGFVTANALPGKPLADPDLLAYEGFLYSGLHLSDTSDGGYGWSGPWYGNYYVASEDPDFDPNNPSASSLIGPSQMFLTHQKHLDTDNLNFEPVGGTAMDHWHQVKDESAEPSYISGPAFRYLADNSKINFDANDDYYVSFLLRRDDPLGDGGGTYAAFKLSYMSPEGQRDIALIGSSSTTAWQIAIRDDATDSVMVETGPPSAVETKKTYFLVAKISTKDSTEGNSDQVFLKVYEPTDAVDTTEPAAWTLSTPAMFNTAETADAAIFYFGYRTTYMFDELRIGKSWQSVTNPVQPCQYPEADANGDCRVDISDFSILADQWLFD